MERLPSDPGRDVWIDVQSARPFAFRSPFGGADFVLLLVDGVGVADGEQHALSAEILRQGCRYAVCTGRGCDIWHVSIDVAYLEANADFRLWDDRFAMTSWHVEWDAPDIADFFLRLTSFGDFTAERFLVLLLGATPEVEREVRAELARRL